MSNEELLKQDPLVAPADSDEQFITRFEYEDPIRKASIWLHKLIIHRLRDVQLAAPWYRGETTETPDRFVSDLFSQADGRFCRRFDYFCRMVKKYRQGEVPRPVIEDDHRAVRILIAALSCLTDNAETLRLFTRRVQEFVSCITTREGGGFLRRDYIRRIDELAESIITISGRVSDEFLHIERIRRDEISEHATKADLEPVAALASACKHISSEALADVASACKHISPEATAEPRSGRYAVCAKSLNRKADALLAVAGETLATAKRIDRRGRRANPRQKISTEVQEQCWRYWDAGRRNARVKSNAKGKTQHAFVFAYYRRELKALGITTESQFKKALKLRSNRISRTAAKK